MNTKELRNKLGLTQAELSEILGLSSQTRIAEYENGARSPSMSVKIILTLLDKKIVTTDQIKKIAVKLSNELQ